MELKFWLQDATIYNLIEGEYVNLSDMDFNDRYSLMHPDVRSFDEIKDRKPFILCLNANIDKEIAIPTTYEELEAMKPTRVPTSGVTEELKAIALVKHLENCQRVFGNHQVIFNSEKQQNRFSVSYEAPQFVAEEKKEPKVS